MAALQVARLAGEAALFTALGGDELGARSLRELEADGVRVHTAVHRSRSAGPSRTSTRPASARSRCSARSSARAGATTPCRGTSWPGSTPSTSSAATSRRCGARGGRGCSSPRRASCRRSGSAAVELDALVGSGEDEGERYHQGDLDPRSSARGDDGRRARRLGAAGGPLHRRAAPGPVEDAYGCGDCFAAGLTYALAAGRSHVEAIAFAGRALEKDAQAKYLNSPETPLFHKGGTLYNIGRRASGLRTTAAPIVAVEGYVDVIAMSERRAISATVAPLGTALTEDQLGLLWKMADEPILCFDGDSAGLRAAYRAVDLAMPRLKPGKSLEF